MIYFTADTHFGHSNIIEATGRPFQTVERMNAALIANINDRVSTADTLYILGDFSYRISVEEAWRLRQRIVCPNVHLVRGNHDKHWAETPHADAFSSEQDYLEIKPGFAHGHRLVLFHTPCSAGTGAGARRFTCTGTSTAVGATTTSATARWVFCATTWAWTPTGTAR